MVQTKIQDLLSYPTRFDMTQPPIVSPEIPVSPPAKKKGLNFPTAFTVLFIILILSELMTFFIQPGKFSTLKYDGDAKNFVITKADDTTETLPATDATLEKLKIKIPAKSFTEGDINKPIAVPGTYMAVERPKKTLIDSVLNIINAPIKGIYNGQDVITFVLIIGGAIGVLYATGTFEAGVAALGRATKGREFLLIAIITTLISIGGTTFGMAEETIAFYPFLIPVFLAAGFDAMVCIAAIYVGSSVGSMFSTVNPFATVIASASAGVNFMGALTPRLIGMIIGTVMAIWYITRYANRVNKNPSESLLADQRAEIDAKFLGDGKQVAPEFNGMRKLLFITFIATFGVMVWGVSKAGWWFGEMTALFLGAAILFGLIYRMREKEWVDKFVAGAADLIGVALIIGLARGVNEILSGGMISDTILNGLTDMVNGMNGSVFAIMMMVVYFILGFFVPSSSGLAVLSMPIMAPLADAVNVPRDIVVSAYQYGLGIMGFITPTGLILASLALVDVTYDRWLKFIMPFLGMITALAIVMLVVQSMM